jgi:hypothetical protein
MSQGETVGGTAMNRTDWSEVVVRSEVPTTDWYWKRGRWVDEALHPVWKDRKPAIAVIHKRPRGKRRRGHPGRSWREQFPYIELKARARIHMRAGMRRRPAIVRGMVEMAWPHATHGEIEIVQREMRRLGL